MAMTSVSPLPLFPTAAVMILRQDTYCVSLSIERQRTKPEDACIQPKQGRLRCSWSNLPWMK